MDWLSICLKIIYYYYITITRHFMTLQQQQQHKCQLYTFTLTIHLTLITIYNPVPLIKLHPPLHLLIVSSLIIHIIYNVFLLLWFKLPGEVSQPIAQNQWCHPTPPPRCITKQTYANKTVGSLSAWKESYKKGKWKVTINNGVFGTEWLNCNEPG